MNTKKMVTKQQGIDRLKLMGQLENVGEINYPTATVEPAPGEDYIPDSEIRAVYAINHSEDYSLRDGDSTKVIGEKMEHYAKFAKQYRVNAYMRKYSVEKSVATAAIEEIEKELHDAVMARLSQARD